VESKNKGLSDIIQNIQEVSCDPKDIALKSFFLGPKAENAEWVSQLVLKIFKDWFQWRNSLYPQDGRVITKEDKHQTDFQDRKNQFEQYLAQICQRFQNEVPNFTPRYIGHMNNEISLPAIMGHIVSLLHNPNNISGEASRVGIQIENEAILDLAEMLGYNAWQSRGHFTSGGSVANFEGAMRARARLSQWLALGAYLHDHDHTHFSIMESAHMGWDVYDHWMGKLRLRGGDLKEYHMIESNPIEVALRYQQIFDTAYRGPVALIPGNKHYSWNKAVALLGLGKEAFWPIALDNKGRLSIADLQSRIQKALEENRPIMMVTSVAGTTEMGIVDPIDEVADFLEELKNRDGLHIWHHVDAAYGGFFCSLPQDARTVVSQQVIRALNGIRRSNSVTIDPHKLGYVPYSSGAFICRNKREYYSQKIDAPYIKFVENRDKGTQTIEGSRSAAGAVSTWLTSKSIGLNDEGYGRILELTIKSRIKLQQLLKEADPTIRIDYAGDTNIVCFCIAREGEPVSKTNERTEQIYEAFSPETNRDFFVSQTRLKWEAYEAYLKEFAATWKAQKDSDHLTFIRCVMMNPFFITKEGNTDYAQEFVRSLLVKMRETEDLLELSSYDSK